MDIDGVRKLIEEDLAWRLEEITSFTNQLDKFKSENDKKRFRKAQVLNKFLGRRNAIAHGDGTSKEGLSEKEYNDFKEAFDKITNMIPKLITYALSNKLYLKEEFRNK